MAIEQGLLQLMTETSPPIVDEKVYWILAPKGAAVPYLVLSRVDTKDFYAMEGTSGTRQGLFQVDCFATTFLGSRALAKAVRSLLENYIGTLPDTDNTNVTAVITDKDWDMPYQEGSKGFVFRAMLHFRVTFNEA